MARDWRDGFADFWGQGSEDASIGRSLDLGGEGITPNIWDHVWGRSGSELLDAHTTRKQDKLSSRFKSPIEALGGKYNRGSTEGELTKQLNSLQRKDDNTAFDASPQGKALAHSQTRELKSDERLATNEENAYKLGQDTLAQQGTNAANTLALATLQGNNQMELSRLQMKDTADARSFDREAGAADRLLTLQLGNMNADLQDRRMEYDRETRSMDKRDRMIAQLMSGLGSLGGAFSI